MFKVFKLPDIVSRRTTALGAAGLKLEAREEETVERRPVAELEVDQIAVEVDQCIPGPAGGGPVQLGGVLHGSSMLLGND